MGERRVCEITRLEELRLGDIEFAEAEHGLGRSPARVGVVSHADEGSSAQAGAYTCYAGAVEVRLCAPCVATVRRYYGEDIAAGYVSVRQIYSMRRARRARHASRDRRGRFVGVVGGAESLWEG